MVVDLGDAMAVVVPTLRIAMPAVRLARLSPVQS